MFFRQNKKHIYIFSISLIVFLLSCFGVFDELSAIISKSLYNILGYTNKWSTSYGPIWFLKMINNISALGGRELVLIFSIIMFIYLQRFKGKRLAKNFLFVMGSAIIFIFITKLFTSQLDELSLEVIVTESLSNFPSGHTFIATVLYFQIANSLSSKNSIYTYDKFLFISASIIIALVGVTRFLGNGHTFTEVIAGWSLGLCWYTFMQIFNKLNHKSFLKTKS